MTRREVIQSGVATILLGGIEAFAQPVKSAIGAAQIKNVVPEDEEEEMYKEMFLGLLNKTLTEVDIADEIDARYGHASGARPFYGQSNITKLRLRNLIADRSSVFYLDVISKLQELWLDNTQILPNSFCNLSNVSYVYMPAVTFIQNPINNKSTPGIFDFGNSRTCQQLLDTWASLFEQPSNVNTKWTFRCSDGDVIYDGSAWVKQSS